MKILITGANSYIGTSFEAYMKKYPDYIIDTIDMVDGSWRKYDFSSYDAVFHVAGLAHQKETKENAELYYKINRDLTIDVAEKAKREGVKQFVFLSSMNVYGMEVGLISKETAALPKSHYGKSKFQAEEYLKKLQNDSFKLAILRPPMVYGKNCKGNYQTLRQLALKSPVFPSVVNKRSMIYIDNLSAFVYDVIHNQKQGIFLPQNKEYIQTKNLVAEIARLHEHKIYFLHVFNPLISKIKAKIIQKAFGTLIYTEFDEAGTIGFIESMRETEL